MDTAVIYSQRTTLQGNIPQTQVSLWPKLRPRVLQCITLLTELMPWWILVNVQYPRVLLCQLFGLGKKVDAIVAIRKSWYAQDKHGVHKGNARNKHLFTEAVAMTMTACSTVVVVSGSHQQRVMASAWFPYNKPYRLVLASWSGVQQGACNNQYIWYSICCHISNSGAEKIIQYQYRK